MYGTVKEIIERLMRRDPDELIGTIIWDNDDVKESVACYRNEKIDDNLAGLVLSRAISSHDADQGISRDTFVCALDVIKTESE